MKQKNKNLYIIGLVLFLLGETISILKIIREALFFIPGAIRAEVLFKKHTPKELKEHCEQLAYVRYQADAMGIIIEKLVEGKFLIVPEKRTNLCMWILTEILEVYANI